MSKFLMFLIMVVLMGNSPAYAKDIYFCPMHPHYTSDRPGNCPICGMTLVKKQEQGSETVSKVTDHAAVSMSENQQKMIGVKTVMIGKGILVKTVHAFGYVARDPKTYRTWVNAEIFESDTGFVDVGQKAMVEIPAYAESFEGIVRWVAPAVDPSTHTVKVRIELSNAKSELKANMSANVLMPVELNDSLLVPKTAVMDTGLRKIVYVQTSAGVFQPREIETGAPGDDSFVIKSGLSQGDSVAVEGNFLLDSESRL